MKCYLLLLQSLLCCVDILLYSHVDELILGFSLDHAGSLLAHALDGLRYVNVTVQPYTKTYQKHNYKYTVMPDSLSLACSTQEELTLTAYLVC